MSASRMSKQARPLPFLAAAALFSLSCNLAHPVTPSLFMQLQLPDYMFGVALACMSLGNMLFSPFWGRMAGRMSSRRVMLVCCLGYAVGQVLFASARSVWQVMAVRLFTGVFVGGVFVGMLTYIVNTAQDEGARGRLLVSQATLEAVFAAAGYFVGGMLGEIGIRLAVAVQACALVLCGACFTLACRDDRIGAPAPLPRGRAFVREVDPFRALVRGKPILACVMGFLMAACALQYFSQTCFDQSFNYYAIDCLGLSTGYNGAIKGGMGLVTLAANSTLCVWLMKRGDVKRGVACVLAVCGTCISAALCMRQAVPFVLLSVGFFALSAITLPMLRELAAAAGRVRGFDGGMVMSFYNAMKNLGGILGALVAGFTYMAAPKAPFVCCALGMFAAAGMAAVYRARTRRV